MRVLNPIVSSQIPHSEASRNGVIFIGPVLDVSGYGFASRYYAASLGDKIPTMRIQQYSFSKLQLKSDDFAAQKCRRLLTKDPRFAAESRVRIIHCPPRDFSHLRSKNSYNIGVTVWESDRLNPDWVQRCNDMDEIWVPCDDNLKWFKQSGVTAPMYVIPHIAPRMNSQPQQIDQLRFLQTDSRFIFYSIFVWQNRKNPLGTLAAYFSEFGPKDKVLLVLKIDRFDHNAGFIEGEISKLKRELNLQSYPPIHIVSGNFSDDQILWMHQQCDCYFQLQHSEGWGLPHFEALCSGNKLITTKFGGPTHFVDQKYIDEGCAWLIDGFLTPVRQDYKYYSGHQNWLEPNLFDAKLALRQAYNSGKMKYPHIAQDIKTRFDFDKIGVLMRDRVLEALR